MAFAIEKAGTLPAMKHNQAVDVKLMYDNIFLPGTVPAEQKMRIVNIDGKERSWL